MASKGIFSSIASALTSAGQSSLIPTVFSSLGTVMNSTSSQVSQKLNTLAMLCNNPTSYAAAAPTVINEIEGVTGLPAGVLPLLETLRAANDPLKIAQTIAAIEAEVSAQTSIL
jgi:hypothetical protein